LTGLHDVIGKRVTELLPGIKKSTPELFDLYGRVAATGRPEKCEIYVSQLSLWRSMSVYSTEKGYFVAVSENITERKRFETNLQESHFNLRKLTAHLNLTREMELKAFARKVHDELGTSLTLLKFDLAWLKRHYPTEDNAVTERIRAMDELIHESTKTVQMITSELRPSLLDEQGLAATIEWQAGEFEKRSGISCNLEIDPSIPSLSQDKTINVFRIFQQSLSNVIRHADATSVLVSLSTTARQLVLRIADNGVGISDQAISSATSFGIMGMKERTRLCNGSITIVGIQGKGTTISIDIPINERGNEQCSAY
jgi:signal transduction histidine kinase